MQSRPTVLIVDDEIDLARAMSHALEHVGFAATRVGSGMEALSIARGDGAPDAFVLDLMLPDVSGIAILRELRSQERTRFSPVVILTASGSDEDRVKALELGADDYLIKPCSMRELALRLRALLRSTPPPISTKRAILEPPSGLHVDGEAHQVFVDGVEVPLTALEFRLLQTLMGRRGRVQTRSRLLQDVWDMEPGLSTRTVDTHIKRVRAKLLSASRHIETVRDWIPISRRIDEPPQRRSPSNSFSNGLKRFADPFAAPRATRAARQLAPRWPCR